MTRAKALIFPGKMGEKRSTSRADSWIHISTGGWWFFGLTMLLLMAAFNSEVNLLYLIGSLLLSAFLASLVIPVVFLRRIEVRRLAPGVAYAGEFFEARWLLKNASSHAAHAVTVADRILAMRRRRGKERYEQLALCRGFVEQLPPREVTEIRARVCLEHRGEYIFEGPSVGCGFPFGLVELGTRFYTRREFLVFPRRGILLREVLPGGPPREQLLGHATLAGRGMDEFRGLREFRPGDSPKHIHWRTTARRGEIYVREMDREQMQDSIILLDTCGEEREPLPPGGLPELEMAISFAAAVGHELAARGATFAFAAFGRSADSEETQLFLLRDLTGETGLLEMLALLARLRPIPDKQPDDLVHAISSELVPGARALGILLEESSKKKLLSALPDEVEIETYVVSDPSFAEVFRLHRCE